MAEEEAAPLYDPSAAPLKVLVWNIQFCAGTGVHFFYEGGDATSVPSRPAVLHTLAALAELITRELPDLVLLQEVDRGARRSWYVDQLDELRRLLPASYRASASDWYWSLPWVPFPFAEMLGRVEMHLCALSRYAIGAARRVALPPVRSDGVLARLFNVRRAVQLLTLPTADGRCVEVLHTHLSAFTGGDGTVEAQVEVLRELVGEAAPHWLLAGDLNALPPGVSAEGLTGQAASAVPVGEMADPARRKRWFTLKYFGREEPEVTIDYLLHAPHRWQVKDVKVLNAEETWPSDHAPLVATLEMMG
ncbi:hypothetical protein AB1Y20_017068 [Prymnesium parvum]|uniref:Endonuclease/exonuclease/phosphatase domain-containing protein n=1 Tax=Prymnesium parvum TaxID=97485 RepID=A0AB34IBE6_PRYPA